LHKSYPMVRIYVPFKLFYIVVMGSLRGELAPHEIGALLLATKSVSCAGLQIVGVAALLRDRKWKLRTTRNGLCNRNQRGLASPGARPRFFVEVT
jgi:hypothetical protein